MPENMFAKQMMSLLKQNMETSFETMSMLQGQNEQIAKVMLEQGAALQANAKKNLEQWMEGMKKSQEEFQKNMQKQIEQLEKLAGGAGKKEA